MSRCGATSPASSSRCLAGAARRRIWDWSHLDLVAAEWRQTGPHDKEPRSAQVAPAFVGAGSAARTSRGNTRQGAGFPGSALGPADQHFYRHQGKYFVEATASELEGDQAPDELDGWTWHDFRRSFATALGEGWYSGNGRRRDPELHRQSATRGGVL